MPVRLVKTLDRQDKNFVDRFNESAHQTAASFLKLKAERLTAQMKDVILGQRYTWYPLDPKYLAEKVKQGYDPRILIRTKQYVESIAVFPEEDVLFHVAFRVGVPTGETDVHNSGLPFWKIARIMEYGRRDGKKPYSRPHWRPTWSLLIRDLPTVTDQFKTQILADFRRQQK